jgi:hypothetical protein
MMLFFNKTFFYIKLLIIIPLHFLFLDHEEQLKVLQMVSPFNVPILFLIKFLFRFFQQVHRNLWFRNLLRFCSCLLTRSHYKIVELRKVPKELKRK